MTERGEVESVLSINFFFLNLEFTILETKKTLQRIVDIDRKGNFFKGSAREFKRKNCFFNESLKRG